MKQENIISAVPAFYIAKAVFTLPHVTISTSDTESVMLEIPTLGQVRFNCERKLTTAGKETVVYWNVVEAIRQH